MRERESFNSVDSSRVSLLYEGFRNFQSSAVSFIQIMWYNNTVITQKGSS